ncbi:Glutamate--tRNA ligase [Bienertia sinuspersici]
MASHHTRSLSFPSKPHPIAYQLDEHLCRLRSSQDASLTNKLTGLNDLYTCVDEFLQLPLNQNTLSEMLDGSLRLLDICATSRDALAQSKERLQDIQSVLRRRWQW